MRRTSIFVLLLAALLFWSLPMVHKTFADDGENGKAFAQPVVGSYFIEIAPEVFPFTFPGMISLYADGNIQATEAVAFGLEFPGYGRWKRTGSREITGRFFFFRGDETGLLDFIGEVTFVAPVEPGIDEFVAPFTIQFFGAEQDPLDPEEEPFFSFDGTLTFRRMTVNMMLMGDDDFDAED